MAASKRVGTQLLLVAIAGAVIAVLVTRTPDFGSSVVEAGDAGHALPVSPPSAAELREPVAAAPTRVDDGANAAPVPTSDSRSEPPSLEQRTAALIATMAERIEVRSDNSYTDDLVKSGLSRTDSEAIAHRFFADAAACAFEETKRQYKAAGVSSAEFVAVAERVWSSNPERGGLNLDSVALLAMPCVADAAQRAGIVLPQNLMARYAALQAEADSSRGQPVPIAEPRPPWAEAAEAAIRTHVAAYPAVVLTHLDVLCQARGCSVVLEGPDVPIYDLAFDVFAEQNGFDGARVGGVENRRVVWLQR